MRRHPITDLPPPLVELDHLRDLHRFEQRRPPGLAGRAQRLEFPRLVGVRDDGAGRAVRRVRWDAGVAAGYEGEGGEGAVAADGVDEEAVDAHCGQLRSAEPNNCLDWRTERGKI